MGLSVHFILIKITVICPSIIGNWSKILFYIFRPLRKCVFCIKAFRVVCSVFLAHLNFGRFQVDVLFSHCCLLDLWIIVVVVAYSIYPVWWELFDEVITNGVDSFLPLNVWERSVLSLYLVVVKGVQLFESTTTLLWLHWLIFSFWWPLFSLLNMRGEKKRSEIESNQSFI